MQNIQLIFWTLSKFHGVLHSENDPIMKTGPEMVEIQTNNSLMNKRNGIKYVQISGLKHSLEFFCKLR